MSCSSFLRDSSASEISCFLALRSFSRSDSSLSKATRMARSSFSLASAPLWSLYRSCSAHAQDWSLHAPVALSKSLSMPCVPTVSSRSCSPPRAPRYSPLRDHYPVVLEDLSVLDPVGAVSITHAAQARRFGPPSDGSSPEASSFPDPSSSPRCPPERVSSHLISSAHLDLLQLRIFIVFEIGHLLFQALALCRSCLLLFFGLVDDLFELG